MSSHVTFLRSTCVLSLAFVLATAVSPAWASKKTRPETMEPPPPELLLEGGRKLSFERSFSTQRDVNAKRGFWTRVLDVVAGEPEFHALMRPYAVVSDSHGRVIVSDPGAGGIHIFDFEQRKYKFVSREKEKDGLVSPQCIAVDAADNIYATDSETGKIFVFRADGKFDRVIGSTKDGEGIFKRPTGIAVDSQAQRIYVTDTLRDEVFVLDMNGSVVRRIGGNAEVLGENALTASQDTGTPPQVTFHFPTDLRLSGDELLVVDAMNFRVEGMDQSGQPRFTIGQNDDTLGGMFRPKGIGVDSEGHIYVAEALSGLVQVFDREGRLLYYFGQKGTGLGEFQLPTGLFIDKDDRVYVVDSYNRRVQVFRYYGLKTAKGNPGK